MRLCIKVDTGYTFRTKVFEELDNQTELHRGCLFRSLSHYSICKTWIKTCKHGQVHARIPGIHYYKKTHV